MGNPAHEGTRMAILNHEADVLRVLRDARRVAVLGIKTAEQPGAAAYYVPAYMQRVGYEIVPVPVYYPGVKEILGQPVYRRLADIPGDLDLVVVFRRGSDIPRHVADILEKKPRAVWFQLGIRNDEVAESLAEAGIDVVQNRCAMIDHRRKL
jgi:uncharacterized protein